LGREEVTQFMDEDQRSEADQHQQDIENCLNHAIKVRIRAPSALPCGQGSMNNRTYRPDLVAPRAIRVWQPPALAPNAPSRTLAPRDRPKGRPAWYAAGAVRSLRTPPAPVRRCGRRECAARETPAPLLRLRR